MKRSGPPERRTPLARKTPIPRGGRSQLAFRRQSSPGAEERRARRLVAERSGGVCEGCGQVRAADWSHRVARSQGGLWCPSNGVHLCAADHAWLHRNPAAARDERGWRLLSTDDPLTRPALLVLHGWVLLCPDGSLAPVESPPC